MRFNSKDEFNGLLLYLGNTTRISEFVYDLIENRGIID